MKFKKIYFAGLAIILLGLMCFNSCKPIRSLTTTPRPWSGNSLVSSKMPEFDPAKKNIFIIADYKLTEIFDMLAPFYLFNATGKANVFIIAKEKTPILIKKDLFLSPQITFREADSMHLSADVMVIPALSIRDENQDLL